MQPPGDKAILHVILSLGSVCKKNQQKLVNIHYCHQNVTALRVTHTRTGFERSGRLQELAGSSSTLSGTSAPPGGDQLLLSAQKDV